MVLIDGESTLKELMLFMDNDDCTIEELIIEFMLLMDDDEFTIDELIIKILLLIDGCLLYTSPSPRDS